MALTEEYLKLVFQAEGADSVKKLATRYQELQGELGQVQRYYETGYIGARQYTKSLGDLERESKSLERQIKKQSDAFDRSTRGFKLGAGNLGMGLMELGRAAQDFQAAGFLGINNNIERLALSMGLGAGLAGVVQVLGVMFQAWQPSIEDFFERVLGEKARSEVEKLKKEIDDINRKPVKIDADFTKLEEAEERLRILEDGLKAFNEASRAHTDYQKKSGAELKRELVEKTGGGKAYKAVWKQVEEGIRAQNGAQDKQLQRMKEELAKAQHQYKVESARGLPNNPELRRLENLIEGNPLFGTKGLRQKVQEAEDAQRKTAHAQTGALFDQSFQGDQASQTVLVKWLEAVGRKDLARVAARNNVAGIQAQEDTDQWFENFNESLRKRHNAILKRDAKKRARDAETDMLNAQGQANQEFGEQRADQQGQAELAEAERGRRQNAKFMEEAGKRIMQNDPTIEAFAQKMLFQLGGGRGAESAVSGRLSKYLGRTGKAGAYDPDALARTMLGPIAEQLRTDYSAALAASGGNAMTANRAVMLKIHAAVSGLREGALPQTKGAGGGFQSVPVVPVIAGAQQAQAGLAANQQALAAQVGQLQAQQNQVNKMVRSAGQTIQRTGQLRGRP